MSDSGERPAPSSPPPSVEGEVVMPHRGGGPRRALDGRKVMLRFVGVVSRLPRYVKLGWLLVNDPTVSARGKAALAGGLAYAISPIDPVPGFIPVLGQLDDMAVLLLSIRTALKSAPTEVADRRLEEVGLSWQALEGDLLSIRATAIWVAHQGGALAVRAGKAMLSAAFGRFRNRLPGGDANDGTP